LLEAAEGREIEALELEAGELDTDTGVIGVLVVRDGRRLRCRSGFLRRDVACDENRCEREEEEVASHL
jgi:hypothetical protein